MKTEHYAAISTNQKSKLLNPDLDKEEVYLRKTG